MGMYGDIEEAAHRAEKSVGTIRRMMRRGSFPRPTHCQGRRLLWLLSEIDTAIERLASPSPIKNHLSPDAAYGGEGKHEQLENR